MPLIIVLAAIVVFTLIARRLGYNLGGEVVARCRRGHVFATIWIPGIKLKAIDLGVVRWQHCPVGAHWSWVVPVRERDLSDEQRRAASEHRDVRIP